MIERGAGLFPMPLAAVFVAAGLGCETPSKHSASSSCVGCSLVLERLHVLGGYDDPGSADFIAPAVDNDLSGNWYVAESQGSDVLVYGPNGRYERSIGRAGRGPGELEGVAYLAVVDDSLHVFSNGRHTVFDTRGEVGRVSSVPGYVRKVLFLPDGTLVIQGKPRTADGFGRPLHMLGPDGNTISFGRADTAVISRREIDLLAAAESADRFWIAHPLQYRLEAWSPANMMLRVIDRQPDWFRWPQDRPKAYIADIWVDTANSQIWTSVAHVHATTRDSPMPMSVVEVIDIRTGLVIASDSVASPPLRFTTSGFLYAVHEDVVGNIVVSAWRPYLIISEESKQ